MFDNLSFFTIAPVAPRCEGRDRPLCLHTHTSAAAARRQHGSTLLHEVATCIPQR